MQYVICFTTLLCEFFPQRNYIHIIHLEKEKTDVYNCGHMNCKEMDNNGSNKNVCTNNKKKLRANFVVVLFAFLIDVMVLQIALDSGQQVSEFCL